MNGKKPIKIIINADDFGSFSRVNKAIISLFNARKITSATIMANGPVFSEAVDFMKQNTQHSYGVHLNMTSFTPLTKSDGLAPILEENGDFAGCAKKVPFSRTLLQAIYQEWAAQIERIQSYGISLSHIDSHQHVHTLPQLFPIVKKIQIKFKIKRVRISRNVFSKDEQGKQFLTSLKKRLWNSALRYVYQTTTTDGFTDLLTFLEVARRNNLSHSVVEIMVHPGSVGYEEEDKILRTKWIDQLPNEIIFINYNNLSSYN